MRFKTFVIPAAALMMLAMVACADPGSVDDVDAGLEDGHVRHSDQLPDAGGDQADGEPEEVGDTAPGEDLDGPYQDTCDQAWEVTLGGTYSGSTCGYTDTADLTCAEAGRPEVFYYVTVPADDMSCWITCFNKGIIFGAGWYDGDTCNLDGAGVCLFSNDGDINCDAKIAFGGGPQGTRIWIAIEGPRNQTCGDYTFKVDCGYF